MNGTLTVEQVLDAIFNGSSYASYDGVKYYASGLDIQAITDMLNAHAEQTCRNEHGCCSVCGAIMYDAPNYCPNCGAKIIEKEGAMMKITDRESLAGAILANGDAAQLFYYCVPMLEEYEATRNESTVGAIAGIIVAIHQILCGTMDYDEDFSVWINDLMHICIDGLHR